MITNVLAQQDWSNFYILIILIILKTWWLSNDELIMITNVLAQQDWSNF